MGKTALIGYTGFVGGNINAKGEFDDKYDHTNIQEIAGKSYDLVVSAGARADKWLINQEPEPDWENIEMLMGLLKKTDIKELVLISSVDVYPQPVVEVDEGTPIDPETNHPYGKHRYKLEEWVRANFKNNRVVRLPGLFGEGLKKNIIYDFMHSNQVEKIHADGDFQFYYLSHLWDDIQKMRELDIRLLNIATEPILVSDIAEEIFGLKGYDNRPEGMTAARYDMKSKHAEAFGGKNGYLYLRDQIMADLKAFVASQS